MTDAIPRRSARPRFKRMRRRISARMVSTSPLAHARTSTLVPRVFTPNSDNPAISPRTKIQYEYRPKLDAPSARATMMVDVPDAIALKAVADAILAELPKVSAPNNGVTSASDILPAAL